MATDRMLKDTVTVFVPTGEDNDGVMQYDVYLMRKVFCRVSAGSKLDKGSLSADDTVTLFVFDGKSVVTKNGAVMAVATACEAIFYVIREGTTTNDISDKFYVVPYDASMLTKPPARSRRITKVYRRKAGSARMWHWEVHAQ